MTGTRIYKDSTVEVAPLNLHPETRDEWVPKAKRLKISESALWRTVIEMALEDPQFRKTIDAELAELGAKAKSRRRSRRGRPHLVSAEAAPLVSTTYVVPAAKTANQGAERRERDSMGVCALLRAA